MRVRRNSPEDAALRDEEILSAAKAADALAHPVRIRILRYILTENFARRSVSNKDIVAAFGYAQATISQHLSKLVIGGLIEARKKGTSSIYYARIGRLTAFSQTLRKIEPLDERDGLPDFLRTGQSRAEDAPHDAPEELRPQAASDSADDDFDDMPQFL